MSFQKKVIIACACVFFLSPDAMAGSILVQNNSEHKIKVASIGGSGIIEAKSAQSIEFKNTEIGADINIWWIKNARELCQIYTPWDRTILVSGKHTITCLSKQ